MLLVRPALPDVTVLRATPAQWAIMVHPDLLAHRPLLMTCGCLTMLTRRSTLELTVLSCLTVPGVYQHAAADI